MNKDWFISGVDMVAFAVTLEAEKPQAPVSKFYLHFLTLLGNVFIFIH